ncbi:hypothetical protein CU633_22425 [Bacillus sp. V3-13]|nr:hypothetical protein CU633_22425 [Bacillus sp. V3-13]
MSTAKGMKLIMTIDKLFICIGIIGFLIGIFHSIGWFIGLFCTGIVFILRGDTKLKKLDLGFGIVFLLYSLYVLFTQTNIF